MFTGHYAPAFALHRRFPDVPLWKLFVAVQGLDLLFWPMAAAGLERMHVDATAAGPLALVLEFMPYSHSLAAAVAWGAAVALALRGRAGVVLGIAVASHWLCDLPMHLEDLPVAAGDGLRVGLGLWRHPVAAWAFESAPLAVSVVGAPRRVMALAVGLLVVQAVQTFLVPLPTSVPLLAAMSVGSYVGFAGVAWWIRRARLA